jgi:hypothetical protein
MYSNQAQYSHLLISSPGGTVIIKVYQRLLYTKLVLAGSILAAVRFYIDIIFRASVVSPRRLAIKAGLLKYEKCVFSCLS